MSCTSSIKRYLAYTTSHKVNDLCFPFNAGLYPVSVSFYQPYWHLLVVLPRGPSRNHDPWWWHYTALKNVLLSQSVLQFTMWVVRLSSEVYMYIGVILLYFMLSATLHLGNFHRSLLQQFHPLVDGYIDQLSTTMNSDLLRSFEQENWLPCK